MLPPRQPQLPEEGVLLALHLLLLRQNRHIKVIQLSLAHVYLAVALLQRSNNFVRVPLVRADLSLIDLHQLRLLAINYVLSGTLHHSVHAPRTISRGVPRRRSHEASVAFSSQVIAVLVIYKSRLLPRAAHVANKCFEVLLRPSVLKRTLDLEQHAHQRLQRLQKSLQVVCPMTHHLPN